MEFDEFPAMNTLIQVAAQGDPARLCAGFEQVRRYVAESEARFSRFRPESELSRLNRSAGAWFDASPEMTGLLACALEMHTLTGGLFNPAVLPALLQAGYDRSLELLRENGASAQTVSIPYSPPAADQIRLDVRRQKVCLPPGMQIDLGGIAKGWIAEQAVRRLADFSTACAVSAGGDMVFHGLPQGQPAWQVSLEDPRDERQVLSVLQVQSGAVVTSSVTRRRWQQGNQSRHHIIDPRSGQPAAAEWLSVTAGAPQAVQAEAFAKAVLIGGSRLANWLLERLPGLWFMAVQPDGSLWGTPQSKEFVYVPG